MFDRTLGFLQDLGRRGVDTRLEVAFRWAGCPASLQDDILSVAAQVKREDTALRRRVRDLWVDSVGLWVSVSLHGKRPLPPVVVFRLEDALRVDLRACVRLGAEPRKVPAVPSVLHGTLSLCGPPTPVGCRQRLRSDP